MPNRPHSVQPVDKLRKLVPPNFRDEDWKYTQFPHFQQYKIQPPSVPDLSKGIPPSNLPIPSINEAWVVVVKNGMIQPHLSHLPEPSSGISVCSLPGTHFGPSVESEFGRGAIALKHGHYFSH
jgi:hypothetical protein